MNKHQVKVRHKTETIDSMPSRCLYCSSRRGTKRASSPWSSRKRSKPITPASRLTRKGSLNRTHRCFRLTQRHHLKMQLLSTILWTPCISLITRAKMVSQATQDCRLSPNSSHMPESRKKIRTRIMMSHMEPDVWITRPTAPNNSTTTITIKISITQQRLHSNLSNNKKYESSAQSDQVS